MNLWFDVEKSKTDDTIQVGPLLNAEIILAPSDKDFSNKTLKGEDFL